MAYKLTAKKALGLLADVVQKQGEDYVYREDPRVIKVEGTCANRYPDGEPACIAGHVYRLLADAGHFEWDAVPMYCTAGWALGTIADASAGFTYTDGAVRVLCAAQDIQDAGGSWGKALRRAVQEYSAVKP